jgi:hypothetical protein
MSAINGVEYGFFGVAATGWEKIRRGTRRFLGLAISLCLIGATTAVLATMNLESPPCSNCRYISCVPFPFGSEAKWWYCDDCDFVTANIYINEQFNEYDTIELTCPGGEIEDININGKFGADREAIQRALPGFCREYCENVTN